MKITKRSTVGIIGGAGKTGAQFAKLFRHHGFNVRVSSVATRARNQEIIHSSDIVLFSLPLSRAAEVMRKELRMAIRSDQLILDVSSLKTREVASMLTSKGEVIGMHPLFGPSTDPKGERIILCPARASKETITSLCRLLRHMGLRTMQMTARQHDDLMATIQVIPHLKSLLMADVLRGRETDLDAVLRTCTPTYEMEFNTVARFLDDHPDLYVPIIFRNPETLDILRRMQALISEYIRIAENGDVAAAERRYCACKKIFGSHLKRARMHSEACIKTLLSLTR